MRVTYFAIILLFGAVQVSWAGSGIPVPASSAGNRASVGKGIDITATKNKITTLSLVNASQTNDLEVLNAKFETEEQYLYAAISRLNFERDAALSNSTSQGTALTNVRAALLVAQQNKQAISGALSAPAPNNPREQYEASQNAVNAAVANYNSRAESVCYYCASYYCAWYY